jgi:LAS superfamily LD-carboxypeptidase LdcB
MSKIFSVIVSFLISTLSIFNVVDIPANEYVEDSERVVVNKVIDVEDSNIGDVNPSKLVSSSSNIVSTTNWWSYPSDIKGVSRSGDDLLVLVNKEYRLPSTYAPTDLVVVGDSVIRRGNNYYLRSIVINDLRDMVNQAKSDGIDLSIVSAYRSYNTQVNTYNYWVSYYGNCVDCADKVSARPGHSQHQLGTTIDFSSNEVSDKLGKVFSDTNASRWLVENAYRYGFVIGYPQGYESITGYSYESWHYRYIGKSNAQEMKNSGNILEIYLRGKN